MEGVALKTVDSQALMPTLNLLSGVVLYVKR